MDHSFKMSFNFVWMFLSIVFMTIFPFISHPGIRFYSFIILSRFELLEVAVSLLGRKKMLGRNVLYRSRLILAHILPDPRIIRKKFQFLSTKRGETDDEISYKSFSGRSWDDIQKLLGISWKNTGKYNSGIHDSRHRKNSSKDSYQLVRSLF